MKTFHGGSSFYDIIGHDFSNLESYKEVINADSLDAWFEPVPSVIEKLKSFLPLTLKMPPPQHPYGLIETISNERKITKERIAVGAGSSDLIFTYFHTQVKSEDTVVVLDPMYGEYRNILYKIGADTKAYILEAENNFRITPYLFELIQKEKPQFVVMVNPNSPTGQPFNCILEIALEMPDTTFFIDEAYIDFLEEDCSVERIELPNLVVLKSMSKGYALSGARVAYLVADPKIIKKLNNFIPPWAVSVTGQIAAIEALKAKDYYLERYRETRLMRKDMMQKLVSPHLKVYPSETNYFMVELLGDLTAQEVCNKLKLQKIFLRNCDSMGLTFNNNFIRIAIKGWEADDKITKALLEILNV